jgi:hypothetical protein
MALLGTPSTSTWDMYQVLQSMYTRGGVECKKSKFER